MPLLPNEPQIFPQEIFTLPELWLVAHVRSRQEKVLARHLFHGGIAFYLPQIEKTVVRNGRRLVSFVPLFPGYVFFRGGGAARQAALRSHVIANLVEISNQQQLNDELSYIWRLQLTGASLIPIQEFVAGDPVHITEGAFAGYRGNVVRTARGERLVVSVSLLRKSVEVEFPREAIKSRRL